MQAAVGYLRVSTREQGRSGLGLAAQRFEIETFGAREGFSINSWYQDVQTGAGTDALLLRPGLAAALKEAKAAHCPLIVSRLDRSRATCTSSADSWSTGSISSLRLSGRIATTSRYTCTNRWPSKCGR
jgi:DNA invertase Pin-like site-specific DNA recombinase